VALRNWVWVQPQPLRLAIHHLGKILFRTGNDFSQGDTGIVARLDRSRHAAGSSTVTGRSISMNILDPCVFQAFSETGTT
jgi:hypothetical protein